jgi:tripartite-type tricarboxylate transporter receptor subunit TctC
LRSGDVQAAARVSADDHAVPQRRVVPHLGLAARQRSRLFPDVPTLGEQGYPTATGGYIMLAGPAGFPPRSPTGSMRK